MKPTIDVHCKWHRNYCYHSCEECVEALEKAYLRKTEEIARLETEKKDLEERIVRGRIGDYIP